MDSFHAIDFHAEQILAGSSGWYPYDQRVFMKVTVEHVCSHNDQEPHHSYLPRYAVDPSSPNHYIDQFSRIIEDARLFFPGRDPFP